MSSKRFHFHTVNIMVWFMEFDPVICANLMFTDYREAQIHHLKYVIMDCVSCYEKSGKASI